MSMTELPRTIRRRDADGPAVVDLGDAAARDASVAGAKAAALARAGQAGLPVLPGFVVTTAVTGALMEGTAPASARTPVLAAYHELSGGGRRAVVVRSSSTIEDGESTSMAGMFTSVLDVHGEAAFLEALAEVLGSAKHVPGIEMAPMAVLVQPQLDARFGGVLFGADPVTGATDRLMVAAVAGGPDKLVSGLVQGGQYLLTASGRQVSVDAPVAGIGRRDLRALAGLAEGTAALFGGPQDVEWAIDGDGVLRLLQSRPITTLAGGPVDASGPVLGPGPVAETFPAALSTLEEDLWVAPLRDGVVEALRLAGATTARRLASSPVVTTVEGRVAADLDLFGVTVAKKRFVARFDPRPPARRLRAAWRVGRLRAALPALARDVVEAVDAQLLDVPDVVELEDAELLSVLDRSRQVLVALHGYEVLAGLLVPGAASGTSGAAVALHALAEGRARGLTDEEIVMATPAVLALVPPSITPPKALPVLPAAGVPAPTDDGDELALLREALRMRVRWVHELHARVGVELGRRLHDGGGLPSPEAIRWCRLEEVADLVERPAGLTAMPERRASSGGAPLPAMFRLSEDGRVVPVRNEGGDRGRGAGGGRAAGVVHDGDGTPPAGAVLVVTTLDPALATVLPHLGGLVAETGSVLSHLAILAREFGVATVVGVTDATRRFPPGSSVVVDGSTGEVTLADSSPDDIDLRGAA